MGIMIDGHVEEASLSGPNGRFMRTRTAFREIIGSPMCRRLVDYPNLWAYRARAVLDAGHRRARGPGDRLQRAARPRAPERSGGVSARPPQQ
jgi:hypothetical protein